MRVLALSPHTDDVELGAGGYIAGLVETNNLVCVKAFSTGNPETGANRDEFLASMWALGVSEYELCAERTRYFPERRQAILNSLVVWRDEWKPDLVLCPASTNHHQDHQVVTNETLRAFGRHCSILGYELPYSDSNFRPDLYVGLTKRMLSAKLAAVKCYSSQCHRSYMLPTSVISLGSMRGIQSGPDWDFAEAFEVLRWIVAF